MFLRRREASMRILPAGLILLACWSVAWPAAAAPAIAERATRESMQECRTAGGRPSLRPEYETTADLNGDGQPDSIIDLSGLNCEGAASYFCGSAGCPVVVYLSGPSGHRAVPLGHVQGWELERTPPLPVLVLHLHGSACGRTGSDGCESRVAWNGREFAALGRGAGARPTPPSARPEQPAASATPLPSWALRPVAGHSPVAVVAGPGSIGNLALLCQQGHAIAAITLRQRPRTAPALLSFSDGRQRVDLPFRPVQGGGEAWYAELAGSDLPNLLLQRDSPLSLAMNHGAQGLLPRQGAGNALRQALGPCLRLR
jgi:hypothetical protein